MKTLGLNIITNQQLPDEKIKDYLKVFDEVCILYNSFEQKKFKKVKGAKTQIVSKENFAHGWMIIDGEVYPNFSKLRQRNLEMSTTDWVMYLDSDDEMDITDVALIKKSIQVKDITAFGILYAYDYGVYNEVKFTHPSPRVFKRLSYNWGDRFVHERIEYIGEGEAKELLLDKVIIKHMRKEHKQSSRNLPLLQAYSSYKEHKDPLTLYYIGREYAHSDAQRSEYWLKEALKLATEPFIIRSAHDLLSTIYFENGDLLKAIEHAQAITAKDPEDIIGLLMEAKLYLAIGWYEQSEVKCEKLYNRFIQNHESIQHLKLNVEGVNIETIRDQIIFIAAGLAKVKKLYDEVITLLSSINRTGDLDIVITEMQYLKESEAKAKIQSEIAYKLEDPKQAFDTQTKFTQIYIDTIQRLKKQTKRKSSVVIVVTQNFEEWDEDTIINKGGGGSETAVVEMAKRMRQDFDEVIIYANPDKEKVINGVTYKKLNEIDFSDEFDVFIGFRDVEIFHNRKIKANKKLLWLQDVGRVERYTPELLSEVDKIIVLSKYHRSTLAHVPEEKFFYTTNGINVELIEEVEKTITEDRELNKMLYCSSADRGLEGLCEMKKIYNFNAEFEWYYGWNSWNTKIQTKIDFRQKIEDLLKESGIVAKGRVSKKELYKAMFTADFLTYPLIGRAETSCIVVMEAQACGLIPITTGITALEETQQWGLKVDIENYGEALYNIIEQNTESNNKKMMRKDMMAWAREKFNWDNVYKQWLKELK
jgi:glycosyltransferase involved in cell wall biosynthesis